MKKNDIYIVIFMTIVAAVLFAVNFFGDKKGDSVVIYFNNEVYKTISLNENKELKVNDTNVVKVEDGKVFMKSANCPDKICVHQAPIDSSGRDIVCLPNKVTVRVISNEKKVDTVVR